MYFLLVACEINLQVSWELKERSGKNNVNQNKNFHDTCLVICEKKMT